MNISIFSRVCGFINFTKMIEFIVNLFVCNVLMCYVVMKLIETRHASIDKVFNCRNLDLICSFARRAHLQLQMLVFQ
jgi:hypothetical protein